MNLDVQCKIRMNLSTRHCPLWINAVSGKTTTCPPDDMLPSGPRCFGSPFYLEESCLIYSSLVLLLTIPSDLRLSVASCQCTYSPNTPRPLGCGALNLYRSSRFLDFVCSAIDSYSRLLLLESIQITLTAKLHPSTLGNDRRSREPPGSRSTL